MGCFAKVTNKLFYGLPLVQVIFLGLFIMVVNGCGGGSNNNDGNVTSQSQVTVAGVVSGSGSLVDVMVSSGGKSASSDVNGYYELANISVPASGSVVLTYEKEGYATFQRSLPVADGETYAVAASLLQYHHQELVDAAQSNNLIIADPGNVTGHSLAEISFPAGSLASSGNVTVEVAVGDPTTEAGRSTFPGDYMAASTLGGDVDTPLESVVFTEITVTDANGVEVTQLNEPATVTVRLPDALQSQYSADDTVPWWSYDETTATWVREDADPATTPLDDAQVIDLNSDGVLYAQAKVTHFSWWNMDVPMNEHACLCVTVQDEDGAPRSGAQLIAEGVSYNGMSRPVRTDSSGRACVTVKRSTGSITERIKLYIESGNLKFYYDVTNANEGDVDSNEIFTPTMQGSTIRNTGQCVDLANTIEQRFDGVISGTVTKEGSGSPVENFTILSNFGPTAITNAQGKYSMDAPVGTPVSLFTVGLVSQNVTVASADTPLIVDFVVPNRVPVITQFTRVPDGIVTSGQTATLDVIATDPDGDALNYIWDTTAGNLNQTTGTSVMWTAPTSGSGTAQTTVIVTDVNGGQTSRMASIVYNETAQTGNRLAFIIKDDLSSDQPVQGTTIALYNTDNRTIAQTQISDASGVVDFGDIGRSRATITFVYEDADEGDKYIDTYINVLVAENIVYYLDENTSTEGNFITNINLTLSDIPVGAGITLIHPLDAIQVHAAGDESSLSNISVNEAHLQNNGKLSMLALTSAGLSDSEFIRYGYMLDQTVANGASYDISLARTPLNLGWSTNPVAPVWFMSMTGVRNGREYNLMPFTGALTDQASSGIVAVANEFPVDHYDLIAVGANDLTATQGWISQVRYKTLPQSLVVSVPDYIFDNVIYEREGRTFHWEVTSNSPRDIISLGLLSNSTTYLDWAVSMTGNTTSWQIMDLPVPASDWFDTANIEDNEMMFSVAVCDLAAVNSMDDFWTLLTSGGSIFDTFQYLYCGTSGLAMGDMAPNVVRKAKAGESSQNVNVSDSLYLLNNRLGHFHRR